MAHSIAWTTTDFEAKPVTTDLVGQTYAFILNTRKAVGERVRTEHCMADDEAQSGNQGRHNMGSARAFYYADGTASTNGSLPSVPSAAVDWVDTEGYSKGRVALVRWPDPAEVDVYWYRFLVYRVDTLGSGWVEPSYVHLSEVVETLQGQKTFTLWPRVADVSTIGTGYPFGNPKANAAALVPVAAVEQALTDNYATVQNLLMPVGFVYVQYPGCKTPIQLWGATFGVLFTEIDYAGAFFRAEGGEAAAYDGAEQAQQYPEHSHTIPWASGSTVVGNTGGGPIDERDWLETGWPKLTVPAATDSAGVGTELRPRNRTMRFWKRTTA